jgi:hypothetical protein
MVLAACVESDYRYRDFLYFFCAAYNSFYSGSRAGSVYAPAGPKWKSYATLLRMRRLMHVTVIFPSESGLPNNARFGIDLACSWS